MSSGQAAEPTWAAEWQAAFHQQIDFVCRSLRRHGVAPADIEDLAQEVFLAMWRRWDTYDKARPLRPWLAGIVFRVARNHGRRVWREVPGRQPDAQDPSPDAEVVLAQAGDRALVLAALARLSSPYREALVLHDIEGVSAQDMAALMGAPEATIYTRLRRARLAFAKVVDQLVGPDERRQVRLAPAALLQLERTPPPAHADLRSRIEQRLRMVQEPTSPPPPESAPPRPRAWPGGRPLALTAVAAAGVILLALVASLARSPREGPAPTPVSRNARSRADRAEGGRAVRARVPDLTPAPPPGPIVPASPAALRPGLLGWWRLDDNGESATVHDSSGNGRDCRLRDFEPPARWIAGVRGRALDLGGRAWLECPFPDTEAGGRLAITVAAWVQRNSTRIPEVIATRQIATGYHDQFFFGFGPDGLRVVSHTWQDHVFEPAPPELHRWFHAAFTHERDGTTKLYVDGHEASRTGGIPGDLREVRAPITFGANRYNRQADKVKQRFGGALDELMVYDRALSAEEIAALAAGQTPN